MSNVDLLTETLEAIGTYGRMSNYFARVRSKDAPQVELSVHIFYAVSKDGHHHIVANLEPRRG